MRTENGGIVGCYTVDLYCAIDHSKLDYDFFNTNYGQFTGRNETACIRAAKKAGWIVTSHNVICPQHAAEKKKVQK